MFASQIVCLCLFVCFFLIGESFLKSLFTFLLLTAYFSKATKSRFKGQGRRPFEGNNAAEREGSGRFGHYRTFGAEAAATSGNSNNNASNDKTVSRSLQYLSDE